MKQINKEEYEKLEGIIKQKNPILQEILKLDVEKGIIISKDEWKLKTPISVMVGAYGARQNKKWQTKTLQGGDKAILRIK